MTKLLITTAVLILVAGADAIAGTASTGATRENRGATSAAAAGPASCFHSPILEDYASFCEQ